MNQNQTRRRPVIAFLGYCDVFEDFYSHYGVTQQAFTSTWDSTGGHAFAKILQRCVGDVIWYEFSLRPQLSEDIHQTVGCRVKMVRSGLAHRALWRLFYGPSFSWRYRGLYRAYATFAAYLAPLSRAFIRSIRADRPEAIFVQDYATGRFDLAVLLARILRIPVVAWHSGSLLSNHLARPVRRYTLPRAGRIVVSSERERQLLAKEYNVRPDRQDVILTPLAIDTYRPLHRDACLRETGLREDRKYFIFVGRLDDRIKRISTIFRALAALSMQMPEAHLLVIGSGPDRAELEKLACEVAPSQVTFLGWIDDPGEKARYYNVAEALLLPSVQEGFPTVVGEAMSCGTPVIASDIGGCRELVKDGITGWLIPPGGELALREAMSRILTSLTPRAGLRANARQAAEARLDPQVVGAALRRCFQMAWSADGH
jgi:glycosyltransferase involved in cell wall biosynthesis